MRKMEILRTFMKYSELGIVCFPVKTNAHPELLTFLWKNGAYFNVSSTFYLDKLIQLEIPSDKILWDNCFSDLNTIKIVVNAGVKNFTVDTFHYYQKINDHIHNAKFFIKISNRLVNSTLYGIGIENPSELIDRIDKDSLLGFSFHLGINAFNYTNLKKMVCFIKQYGKCKYLNIGGGYENFFETYDIYSYMLSEKKEGWFDSIVFEPGRSLLYPASKLYTTVLNVNRNSTNWAKIDASIYSGLMDKYIENRCFVFCDHSPSKLKYILYGFTSDSSDSFGVQLLSSTLKIGDILELEKCGAYNYDMSCDYSGAKKLLIRMV